MESFIIEGGHRLSGSITPQGAKNEALEVICATLLTEEPVRMSNIPDILDVNNLIQLLRDIGVKVTRHSRNDYTFQASGLNLDYLDSLEFVRKCASLRGSVLMIGPLLGRFGKATVAKPGGDKIGRRRLDTHFLGFKNLGAQFVRDEERDVYQIRTQRLIMRPASPTSSSCATCSTPWAPASAASAATYSPSSERPVCTGPPTACCPI